MFRNLLVGLIAASSSFAIVSALPSALWADQCTGLETADCGWGVSDPLVDGFCCVKQYAKYLGCGTGIKATVDGNIGCGALARITNNQCGTLTNTYCGGAKSQVGCTSGYCPE